MIITEQTSKCPGFKQPKKRDVTQSVVQDLRNKEHCLGWLQKDSLFQLTDLNSAFRSKTSETPIVCGEVYHLSHSSRRPPSLSHCSWLWHHWMKQRKLVVLWEWTTNPHVPMETKRRGWTVLIGGCCAEGVGIYEVAVETGRKHLPLRAWGRLQTAAAATTDRTQQNESGSIFINNISY